MAGLSFPFRRQYFRLALRALREARLGWLVSTAAKTLAVPASHMLGRPLAGPLMGILVPTYRCNNACFMCDLPKPSLYKSRGGEEADTAQLKAMIDDMAAIGVAGLTLTGGEPTIRSDCFELLSHAKACGLFVHLNTNGYNLDFQSGRIEGLLATRIDAMNISLDGAVAQTHDRLRNAKLGFHRIAKATESILAQRKRGCPTINYTFVLGPENCTEVPAFVELAEQRGVDSVSFIPLAGCYEGAELHSDERLREMDEAVAWLRAQKTNPARAGFIDNSDAYLSLFPQAFRSVPSPLRCLVGYHNVIVDCYGNVYPCALHYEVGKSLGNVNDKPLREMWHSAEYQTHREELTACTDCYWNCHTEINLLYQSAPV